MRARLSGAVVCALVLVAGSAFAQSSSPTPPPPKYEEFVQVTATRIPEESGGVPANITVISGDELRDRGVTDLRGALALAAGIDIAPGGDSGPAGSVPEFWGLKEFDAFLLVVDGTPWGGAFNPELASLDLHDVERIELQHGPAPVMFGATSFVGVIHVVHRPAGSTKGAVSLTGGSYSSGGGTLSLRVPTWAGFDSSLSADFGKVGYADDRTQYKKTHLLWRNRRAWGAGSFHFDVDGTWLRQDPASPHPREGPALSTQIPIDANHNPAGAFLNQDRYFVAAGFDRPLSFAGWSATVSFAHTGHDFFRGFLTEVGTDRPNAAGVRGTAEQNDLYFDTHLAWTKWARVKVVAGLDYLFGKANAEGDVFDYFVNLDGSGAPGSADIPTGAEARIEDTRSFGGLYSYVEWNPAPAWRLEAGARLNYTHEERGGGEEEQPAGGQGEKGLNTWRASGGVGATWTAWQREHDSIRLFGNWKNSFKPAAVDLNLAEEAAGGGEGEGILKPETANSFEAGVRARRGRFALDVGGFFMDFRNLVIAQSINGLPALTNAGQERMKGVDVAAVYRFPNATSTPFKRSWPALVRA